MSFAWKSVRRRDSDTEMNDLIPYADNQSLNQQPIDQYVQHNDVYNGVYNQTQQQQVPTTELVQYTPQATLQDAGFGAQHVPTAAPYAYMSAAELSPVYGQSYPTATPAVNPPNLVYGQTYPANTNYGYSPAWFRGMPTRYNANYPQSPSLLTNNQRDSIQQKIHRQTEGEGKVERLCSSKAKMVMIIVSVSVLLATAMILAIYFAVMGQPAINKAMVKTTVYLPDAEYLEGYADSTSQDFADFASKYCDYIDDILQSGTQAGYLGCQVTKLTNGSVLVNADVSLNEDQIELGNVKSITKDITDDIETNLKNNDYGQPQASAEFDITTLDSDNVQELLSAQGTTTSATTTTAETTVPSTTMETTIPSTTMETTAPSTTIETTAPSTTTETTAPSTTIETTAPSTTMETTAPSTTMETTVPSTTIETTAPSTTMETTAPSTTIETTAPSTTMETTAPSTKKKKVPTATLR